MRMLHPEGQHHILSEDRLLGGASAAHLEGSSSVLLGLPLLGGAVCDRTLDSMVLGPILHLFSMTAWEDVMLCRISCLWTRRSTSPQVTMLAGALLGVSAFMTGPAQ